MRIQLSWILPTCELPVAIGTAGLYDVLFQVHAHHTISQCLECPHAAIVCVCDAEATACLADVPLIWYILWLQRGKVAADGDASEEGEL